MKIDLNKVWTVQEFADDFGFNAEYVRQCCRGQLDFRTGTPLHLPEGWSAIKIGREWLIVPKDRRSASRCKSRK